jgi:hypothetical protein
MLSRVSLRMPRASTERAGTVPAPNASIAVAPIRGLPEATGILRAA